MQEQKNEYWSKKKSTITVKFVIKIVYRTGHASNFPSWYLWRKLYENPGLTYSESFLAAATHCGKLLQENKSYRGVSRHISRFWCFCRYRGVSLFERIMLGGHFLLYAEMFWWSAGNNRTCCPKISFWEYFVCRSHRKTFWQMTFLLHKLLSKSEAEI